MSDGRTTTAHSSAPSTAQTLGTGAQTTGLPLRHTMKAFATGVTVMTVGSPFPHGMTANAFTSVSLEPPLVLCCVKRNAGMREAMAAAGRFGVSILSSDQEDVARYFADRDRPSGHSQFDRVGWRAGALTDAPLLNGAAAWLECAIAQEHEAGDHSIIVAEVLASHARPQHRALLFFGGRFHALPEPGEQPGER